MTSLLKNYIEIQDRKKIEIEIYNANRKFCRKCFGQQCKNDRNYRAK